MIAWNPQQYKFEGERRGISSDVLDAATQVIERVQSNDPRLPPIFTLRHLCALTHISYGYLRKVVSRRAGRYKRVLFKKKVPGRSRYREINIPEGALLDVQRWISNNILRYTNAHSASFAYHPYSQPVIAASQHCGCKWLLKIDIEDFFHSISERMVYSVFQELGYTKLLSFELARITTMVSSGYQIKHGSKINKWQAIPNYSYSEEGFLPQGAPTSPMLSNLVMKKVDEELITLAASCKFKYTRYADDLAFSTDNNITFENMADSSHKCNKRFRFSIFLNQLREYLPRGLKPQAFARPMVHLIDRGAHLVLAELVEGHAFGEVLA